MIVKANGSWAHLLYLVGVVAICSWGAAYAKKPFQSEVCDLSRLEGLENVDLSVTARRDLPMMGFSTQGGEASIFKLGNVLVSITARFYGETGRTEISYYKEKGAAEVFLVVSKTYRYSSPINVAGTNTASISEDKFVICGNEVPNYPNAQEIENEYQLSIDVLRLILN